MSGKLEGKVAFITGAGRGQGRSHAVRMAKEGADIIAVDVCKQLDGVKIAMSTPDDLAETADQVEALGRRIHAVEADVRDEDVMTEVVREASPSSVASISSWPMPGWPAKARPSTK